MNKIHRVVWSTAAGAWVVASEAARTKAKGASARSVGTLVSTAALLMMGMGAAHAASICSDGSSPKSGVCQVNYNPIDNDGMTGSTIVDGGQSITLSGNASSIQLGNRGSTTSTWGQLVPELAGKYTLQLGAKSQQITTTDPDTGASKSISTYRGSSFTSANAGATEVTFYANVNDAQYVNSVMMSVTGGGTGTINIGAKSFGSWTSRNAIDMAAKGVKLASAKGAGSTVDWASRNRVSMYAVRSPAGTTTLSQDVTVPVYAGTFTGYDGRTYTVNTASELSAYNDSLIAALRAGKLATQQAYDAAFNQAVKFETKTYTYDVTVDKTDEANAATSTNYSMYVDGVGAKGRILAGALLDQNGGSVGVVNGGTFEVLKNGSLASRNELAMDISSGGSATNNGVISGGFLADGNPDSTAAGAFGDGQLVSVVGVGSSFTNNGIMNIAGTNVGKRATERYGIRSGLGSMSTNNGIINVGVNHQAVIGSSQGAIAEDAGGFTNSESGLIYIGRAAQYNVDAPEAVVDTDNSQPTAGILARSGAVVRNEGRIVIGSQTQGADGIAVYGSVGSASNRGTIDINGAKTGSTLTNTGMHAIDSGSSAVANNGVINVNGTNGIGVKVESSTGQTARADSTGVINVTGDSDLNSTQRNYGAWVENEGSMADLFGAVNLTGDGAIGGHARNGGRVVVSGNDGVKFNDGTGQIGLYANGSGSSVSYTGTAAQEVGTEGSTLYRMEDGADFGRSTTTSSQLIASGQNSTAVWASGANGADVSAVNSGALHLQVSGEGATGVRVEGGAQGRVDRDAVIELTGQGAVAGIADGQNHDINGTAVGGPVAGSVGNASLDAGAAGFATGTVLVNDAALNSAQDGVTGYVARNGAEVRNTGSISLTGAGATGVRVEAGSRGSNTGDITVGAGSTGIDAQDASGAQTTVVESNGNIVLSGGSVGQRAVGINAAGAQTAVNLTGGTISLNGDGAVGVQVSDGATVNVSGSSSSAFDAGSSDQILYRLSGAGTRVNIDPSASGTLDASSTRSTVFRLDDGATMNAKVKAAASGEDATVLSFNGDQTVGNVQSGSVLTVNGVNAQAVRVSGGATATVQSGAVISLAAPGATAGVVDGNAYALDGTLQASDTGSTLTNASTLNSSGADVVGFVAQNQGKLINQGSINMTGAGSQAVRVVSGQLDNSGNISANGTAIYVQGADSTITNSAGQILATDGTAAVELGEGASLDLVGSGLGRIEGRGTAHGVLVGEGATGLNIDGAHIVVNAAGAAGHGIENAAEINNLQLNDTTIDVADGIGLRTSASIDKHNSGTINVSGAGTGIAFQNADGSQSSNSLDLSQSQGLNIKVTGANGQGIVANTTGLVDTAASIDVANAAGGSALVLREGVTEAINRGTLTSSSTVAPTVSAQFVRRFTNAQGGVIAASASGDGVALGLSDGDSEFINQGTMMGAVKMGEGDNTAVLDDGSTLDGTLLGGTGSDLVTVKGNASFGALDGVSGSDKLVFDGAQYTHSDSNAVRHFDTVQLSNNSTVTLKEAMRAADDGSDSNAIAIDAGSTLAVAANSGAFVLNNPVQGAGTITTSSRGDSFDFGTANAASTGANFTGTLSLGDSTFALKDQNTTALSQATLHAGEGSLTVVGDGRQQIKALDIDGGTVRFSAEIPDQYLATSHIAADNLDASHAGIVQVSLPDSYVTSPKDTPDTINLLKQDDANIDTQLVVASQTVGYGGNLVVQDQQGNVITNAKDVQISQGDDVVADGTYDFRLTTAPGDGLYVNWGLKQLDLHDGKTLVLGQDSDATGADADMSARITGSGSLSVDAGASVVSLSNEGNDYSGDTTVATGTLRLDADNALGQTRKLNIENGATADLNGKTQTIGALNGLAGSTLALNDGTLNIADGGNSAGALSGSGQLNVTGGELNIAGANDALSAETTIGSAATVRMDNVAGLGTGAIEAQGTLALDNAKGNLANDIAGSGIVTTTEGADVALAGNNSGFDGQFAIERGTTLRASQARHLGTARIDDEGSLVVNNATDWTLDNDVSGAGDLVKAANGTLTVGGSVLHSGATQVQSGTLIVGSDASQADRRLGAAGAGDVTVAQGATLAGSGIVSGHVENEGVISALNALPQPAAATRTLSRKAKAAPAPALPNSTLTLEQGLTNRGLVQLAGPDGSTPGNVLHVKGDYVGDGGKVQIRTVMGDDASATDKLVIDGGDASGSTGMVIKTAGGQGAQTLQGIRVVETQNGATTSEQAFHLDAASPGYRQGKGTLVAGAYDYSLKRGGNGGQADDWYLTSATEPVITTPTPTPTPPVDGGTETTSPPAPSSKPSETVVVPSVQAPSITYRPEVGAYLANRTAAMQMTAHTMHDRQGLALTGSPDDNAGDPSAAGKSNTWLRMGATDARRDGVDANSTVSDRTYLLHGGADVLRLGDGADGSIRIGAMGMYGRTSSNYTNDRGVAQGDVEGYNLGVYGTWNGNEDTATGPYVDTWVMGGKYKNSVQGQGLAKESYNATGVAASVEAGYAFKVLDNGKSQVIVTPQAQVMISTYRAADHNEGNGTVVSGMNDSQVTTRLGVRVDGKTKDDAAGKQLRPFAELNWWHGKSDATMGFNGDHVREQLPADRLESKVGLQGNLSKRVSAWGAVGGEVGGRGYKAANVQAGFKYSW